MISSETRAAKVVMMFFIDVRMASGNRERCCWSKEEGEVDDSPTKWKEEAKRKSA